MERKRKRQQQLALGMMAIAVLGMLFIALENQEADIAAQDRYLTFTFSADTPFQINLRDPVSISNFTFVLDPIELTGAMYEIWVTLNEQTWYYGYSTQRSLSFVQEVIVWELDVAYIQIAASSGTWEGRCYLYL